MCLENTNVWTEILSRKDKVALSPQPALIDVGIKIREEISFAFDKLKSYDWSALTKFNWNALEYGRSKKNISVLLRLCSQEYVFNHVKKLMLNCQTLNVIFKKCLFLFLFFFFLILSTLNVCLLPVLCLWSTNLRLVFNVFRDKKTFYLKGAKLTKSYKKRSETFFSISNWCPSQKTIIGNQLHFLAFLFLRQVDRWTCFSTQNQHRPPSLVGYLNSLSLMFRVNSFDFESKWKQTQIFILNAGCSVFWIMERRQYTKIEITEASLTLS